MGTVPKRSLPAKRNPLITDNVPEHEKLVARRRLAQTNLSRLKGAGGLPPSADMFDYVHLRAPLPEGIASGVFQHSPDSYFIMRRCADGYVSASGMFRVTFPYASELDEVAEHRYLRSLPSISPDETAGNLWLAPDKALELAEEYQISPWIRALLDLTDVVPAKQQENEGTAPQASSKPGSFESRSTPLPNKTVPKVESPQTTDRVGETIPTNVPRYSRSTRTKVKVTEVMIENTDLTDNEAADLQQHDEATEPGSKCLWEPKVKIVIEEKVTKDASGIETKSIITTAEVPLPATNESASVEEISRAITFAKRAILNSKGEAGNEA